MKTSKKSVVKLKKKGRALRTSPTSAISSSESSTALWEEELQSLTGQSFSSLEEVLSFFATSVEKKLGFEPHPDFQQFLLESIEDDPVLKKRFLALVHD